MTTRIERRVVAPLALAAAIAGVAACKQAPRDRPPTTTAPAPPAPAPTPAAPTPAASAPESPALPPPANAVQAEMQLLERAVRIAVTAVGRDQLAEIPHAIHAVHEARTATEQALAAGAWKPVTGTVEAFAAIDAEFHTRLEALVEGALANDHAATAAALGRVLAGCQTCHATYRPTLRTSAPATPPAAGPDHAHH